MTQPLRLFIALELPPEIRETLRSMRERLEAQHLRVRWVDPDGAHLTLKFLGSTPPEHVERIVAALHAVGQHHQPFTLHTTHLGVFPKPREPRVIWLGIGGALPALHALRQDVERLIAPLGYPTEARAFNPHLTLGRTFKDIDPAGRATIGAAIAQTAPPPATIWQVTAVSLIRSDLGPQGAHYTPIATVTLDSD